MSKRTVYNCDLCGSDFQQHDMRISFRDNHIPSKNYHLRFINDEEGPADICITCMEKISDCLNKLRREAKDV